MKTPGESITRCPTCKQPITLMAGGTIHHTRYLSPPCPIKRWSTPG